MANSRYANVLSSLFLESLNCDNLRPNTLVVRHCIIHMSYSVLIGCGWLRRYSGSLESYFLRASLIAIACRRLVDNYSRSQLQHSYHLFQLNLDSSRLHLLRQNWPVLYLFVQNEVAPILRFDCVITYHSIYSSHPWLSVFHLWYIRWYVRLGATICMLKQAETEFVFLCLRVYRRLYLVLIHWTFDFQELKMSCVHALFGWVTLSLFRFLICLGHWLLPFFGWRWIMGQSNSSILPSATIQPCLVLQVLGLLLLVLRVSQAL